MLVYLQRIKTTYRTK